MLNKLAVRELSPARKKDLLTANSDVLIMKNIKIDFFESTMYPLHVFKASFHRVFDYIFCRFFLHY